jgi:CHAT domain-containing protein
VVCCLAGCRPHSAPNAQVVHDDVQAHLLRGELTQAQAEAHSAREQFAGYGAEWNWKFRLLEARALVLQGRSNDVLTLLADALPEPLSRGDMAIQRDLQLAMAWTRLGDDARAAKALDEAQLLVGSNHSSLGGELLNIRGVVALQHGELQQAESFFQRGLALARQQNDTFLQAYILLNIGVVALRTEHYDEALYWSHAASSAARSIDARLTLEKALTNEGRAYFELGDFERSLVTSQQAEIQAENLGSRYDQVTLLNNAGLAMYEAHDYKGAESFYKKSLALAESIQNREKIRDAHVALAFQQLELGQDAQAQIHADRALEAARSAGNKSGELEPLFLQALLADRRSQPGDADRILQTVYQSPSLTPSLRWEVEDAVANLHAKQNGSKDAEQWYRKAIDTFESQRSSLTNDENKLPFFSNASQLYRDYVEYLIECGKPAQALQAWDRGRARTLEEGLGISRQKTSNTASRTPNAGRLASEVDPRAVARVIGGSVLEYSLGPKHSYLWAITANTVRLFELPGEAEIGARVKEYQADITSSNDVLAKRSDAGVWLYTHLVAPASSLLPTHSKVFLIPDGSLNHVNFETFLAPEPNLHFWLEDVILTTGDSLRMLRNFRAHPPESVDARLLLIGNPISPADQFADLPNASSEVDSVASHFSSENRSVLTRADATPGAYLANHPDRFTYIHFVAHGVANQLSPLDSAVLLSRTVDRSDNFKLYARDIVHLPINAKLVTISTCYGSGTKSFAGEGMVGLSWAFLRAGSHNVIGAMWAVSDASTPQLMDHLYDSLGKGVTPDVALRDAKLSMAHSRGVYRKPLYWGAFQLYSGA